MKNGTDGASCSATGPTSPEARARGYGSSLWEFLRKFQGGPWAPNGYPSEMAGLSFKIAGKGRKKERFSGDNGWFIIPEKKRPVFFLEAVGTFWFPSLSATVGELVVKSSVANVGINRASRICSQFNEKTVLKKNTLGKSGICWASNVAVFCLTNWRGETDLWAKRWLWSCLEDV